MRRFQAGLPFAAMLLCVAWPGTALGQFRQPQVPQVQIPTIEVPAPPQIDWEERMRQMREEEERRSAAAAQFTKYAGPPHNPAEDYASPQELTRWMDTGFAVAVVGLLAWVGVWAYTRYGRAKDPTRYVMSDPWVQAHMKEAGPSKDASE